MIFLPSCFPSSWVVPAKIRFSRPQKQHKKQEIEWRISAHIPCSPLARTAVLGHFPGLLGFSQPNSVTEHPEPGTAIVSHRIGFCTTNFRKDSLIYGYTRPSFSVNSGGMMCFFNAHIRPEWGYQGRKEWTLSIGKSHSIGSASPNVGGKRMLMSRP